MKHHRRLRAAVLPVLCLIALASPLRAAESSSFSRQFLAHVNLDAPGLGEAKALAAKGDYDAALAAWRDHIVYRLRAMPLGEFGWHGNQGHPTKQEAVEKQLDKMELTPDEIGDFSFGAPMAFRYAKTGEGRVVQRWFEFMDQAAAKGLIQKSSSWDVGTYTVKCLGAFAKLLPDDQPREADIWKRWGPVLAPRAGTVTPEGLAMFPPETLAHLATAVALEWPDSPTGLVMFAKAGRVPNQRLGGLKSLMLVAVAFDSLKRAPDLQLATGKAIQDVARDAFYADGGDLEQSFNYNFGDAKSLTELVAMFADPRPAWCGEVEATVDRFYALMAGLTTPWGGLPRVGNYGGSNVTALWKDATVRGQWQAQMLKGTSSGGADAARDEAGRRIVNGLFGDGNEPPPLPFTSVAFPYSGYYILRGGWCWDSPYAFFMGARPGRGHSMRDRNSLQLAAFGRRLIVTAGPGTYGFGTMPDSVRRYFDEDSAYKCNTMIVNGQRQTQANGVALCAYRQPIPLRWHTSAAFDLVEGVHDSGYGENFNVNKKGKQAIDTGVIHQRQLLFLRGDTPIWVVTDRMLVEPTAGQASRQYTQMWHFPPPAAAGFSQEQVNVDEAARCVRTTDPTGPNLLLRHFAPQPLHYSTYWGKEDEPALGWYAHGLGDPRQAAVDLHVKWEGEGNQTVVTVLVPMRPGENPVKECQDLSAGGVCGFRMMLADGRTLHYLAATQPTNLQTPQIAAVASALFVVSDANGTMLNGMVLDCQNVSVGKARIQLPLPDARLEHLNDGQLRATPIFKRLAPNISPPGTSYADFALAEPATLCSPQSDLQIRFTTDGSDPDERSPLYTKPVAITAPCTIKARLAKGSILYPDIATETYSLLSKMRAPEGLSEPLENGLRYAYYEAEPNDNDGWKKLNETVRTGGIPKKRGVLDYFSTTPWERQGKTALVFSGYLSVPHDGIYRFTVKGPGLSLYIHNPERETAAPVSLVASATGESEKSGEIALQAGKHCLRVEYTYYWGEKLAAEPVDISGPGLPRQPLPKEWLWREKEKNSNDSKY